MTRGKPISMRDAAMQIVRELRAAGHAALFAGGCVRDMLMRRRPADFDVATDAHPPAILRLFRRTQKVGVQFGVVIVGVGPHWVEVATFRSDLEYKDGRHPVGVKFSSPREDARRRDFTINGMFYDPIERQVIDYVGGRDDLKARVLRAIGDPATRFAEDHLRMLRAVRFSSRLGFKLDPATRAAVVRHAADLARVSPERICDELERILVHPSRSTGWHELCKTGLLPYLWQGAAALERHTKGIAARLAALPKSISFELGLAAVLAELTPDETRRACRALRTSNATRDAVLWLTQRLADLRPAPKLTDADLKLLMARPQFAELLALWAADLRMSGESLSAHRRLERRAKAIPQDAVAPPPLLRGDDLAAMRIAHGPIYKTILDRVYYAQLNDEIAGRSDALALARRLLQDANLDKSRDAVDGRSARRE